jgi:hypothetical protein
MTQLAAVLIAAWLLWRRPGDSVRYGYRPAQRFSSRQQLHSRGKSAEPMRRPAAAVAGLCRARDRARPGRGARRQPRTWVAHFERAVRRGMAVPGTGAALVLPHHPGSWGRIGGGVALLVGIGFGISAWRGPEREATGTPRRDLP